MPLNLPKLCSKVEPSLDRRDFFLRLVRGIGSVALSALLARDGAFAAESTDPLAPKPPHIQPRAKACIFLFMYGAPSQMDTFDPKPALNKFHGTPITRVYGSLEKRMYVGSPYTFSKHGKCGME